MDKKLLKYFNSKNIIKNIIIEYDYINNSETFFYDINTKELKNIKIFNIYKFYPLYIKLYKNLKKFNKPITLSIKIETRNFTELLFLIEIGKLFTFGIVYDIEQFNLYYPKYIKYYEDNSDKIINTKNNIKVNNFYINNIIPQIKLKKNFDYYYNFEINNIWFDLTSSSIYFEKKYIDEVKNIFKILNINILYKKIKKLKLENKIKIYDINDLKYYTFFNKLKNKLNIKELNEF